jgi:hypothetical protein
MKSRMVWSGVRAVLIGVWALACNGAPSEEEEVFGGDNALETSSTARSTTYDCKRHPAATGRFFPEGLSLRLDEPNRHGMRESLRLVPKLEGGVGEEIKFDFHSNGGGARFRYKGSEDVLDAFLGLASPHGPRALTISSPTQVGARRLGSTLFDCTEKKPAAEESGHCRIVSGVSCPTE